MGPNNSGKSLALREISAWAKGDDTARQIVDDLDVVWPEDEVSAEALVKPFETEAPAGQVPPPDSFLITRFDVNGGQQQQWLTRPQLQMQLRTQKGSSYLRSILTSFYTERLDGRTRFSLMEPRPWQDLQLPPQHHLAGLFLDDNSRRRVRELVAEAFPGRHMVVDPTGMQQFRVRMSSRAPADPTEERSWDQRAQSFHNGAEPIETLSDGVICFAGLVAAALALPHQILLVDEPEAFLHPPLARLLGADLATLAAERGANLIAATHSAEFLMGCIESGIETTIVRLTYDVGTAGARVLSHRDLQLLISDPLLRSTRALTGLFHRGVVVGESDHDRAFYDEINRRLGTSGRGAPDTFFTNAQNWQTIPRVVGPLRQLGVPAAAIIDLDAVANNRTEWNKFYKAAAIDAVEVNQLETLRTSVALALRTGGKDGDGLKCKKTGLSSLSTPDKRDARKLFQQLAQYGIFVVPVGELESWLPGLGVSRGAKAKWIVDIFAALGSNPKSKKFVTPGQGDVWRFVDGIGSWIRDPKRLGLP